MMNLKIGVRLGLGFGSTILLMLMLVIAVIGITQLAGMNQMIGNLTGNVYPKADAVRHIELYDTDRGRLARTITNRAIVAVLRLLHPALSGCWGGGGRMK